MLKVIKDIFDGMLYLERNNIIHRDLKPANIFLKGTNAIVADLGFAKKFKYNVYHIQGTIL